MRLCRSSSESKVSNKSKKAEERANKSRSVHFDGSSSPNHYDEFNLEPISIIGRQQGQRQRALMDESDVFSSGDDGVPPQNGKKKVIHAKRPNNLLGNIRSKIKRRRSKSKYDVTPHEDEGFESGMERNGAITNGQPGNRDSYYADVEDVDDSPIKELAPLANVEDIEDPILENTDGDVNKEPIEPIEAAKELTEEERKIELRKHPFFKIHSHVNSGKGLIAMDRGGRSDPYLKCIHGQEKLFQTRVVQKTISPVWKENFISYVDNPFKPLTFQVYDKDLVGTDDFMGEATLDLTSLQLGKMTGLVLDLKNGDNEDLIKKNKKRKPLGAINIKISLTPISKEDMNEVLRAEKLNKGGKTKGLTWSAVVHVVMVQARDLIAMDAGDSSDPYCKISLGREKFKTKSISNTINPKWREGFDLYWYEEFDSELEMTIWDKDLGSKDDFMGRVRVNLKELAKEVTHNLWRDVENGKGQLNILVTISGTTKGDAPSNLAKWEDQLDSMQQSLVQKYKAANTFYKMKDVGHLIVKVFKAQGLHSADLGGKSDPFVVLELVNSRLQTNTEYKTLAPTWSKVFQFEVKDIHDFLDLTVYDEDKDHKYEFLGRVRVPLLRIRNNERRWYYLKDKKLRKPAKGDSPQILLEMFFVYNKFRAAIRTINPQQLKYEDKSDSKFKHAIFMRNLNRVKAATADYNPEIVFKEIRKILHWENPWKSAGCFVGFLLGVYFLELWMVTLALLIPFIKNIIVISVTGGWSTIQDDEDYDDDEEEVVTDGKDKDGEKKSLKEKMQAMQEVTLMVQNGLGMVAHVLESLGNVFNFSVPFLSWMAFVIFCIVTVILYFVPLRAIIFLWGINKFTKKLLRPRSIDNNELADFISRVPDNEELKDFRELQPPEEAVKKVVAKRRPMGDNDII